MQDLTLKKISEDLKAKKVSSKELAEYYLDRIEQKNKDLNAYIHVDRVKTVAEAVAADERRAAGKELSEIDGVPLAIKDIINTKGTVTSCASNMLKNFVPPYDATVMGKLREAGIVMTGKTNTDEFACGGSTEYSAFGPTKNPWDLSRVAGGSSGGSAAAVAADLCAGALGTDTGGSIRQPAAFCGVSGIKVTYGRVSRSGVTAMASSLDTIGAFGKTVEDLAILLKYMAGNDPKDSTTPQVAVPDYAGLLSGAGSLKGLRIGVPKEYFVAGLDGEIEKSVKTAIAEYEKMGATLKEISLPNTKYAVAVYYIIMPAELSTNLSRMDGIRFGLKPEGEIKEIVDQYYLTRDQGFGDEVKRRILTGTYVLSAGYFDAYYKKALRVRTLIKEDFARAFEEVDVIMTPVSPTPAFKIGEKSNDPLAMYLEDAFTIPASVAGVPGLTVPCGLTNSGLPIGLQIIGPAFSEEKLFQVGHAYQLATDWHTRRAK